MLSLDPHTASNYQKFLIKKIHFQWNVDFESKKIYGSALYSILQTGMDIQGCSQLVLDTKELKIVSVAQEDNAECNWKIDKSLNMFSDALVITINHSKKEFYLKIIYETTSKGTALQWLNKEQTVGKKFPYLFTQCQAIHARTLFPCQDTSSVKFVYTAEVSILKHYPLLPLMSAIAGKSKGEVYCFEQLIPIPSYLVALAVGDLHFKDISDRCRVWSEAEIVFC